MLSENLSMQMEAENADLYDRNLMALYGVQTSKTFNKLDGTHLPKGKRTGRNSQDY